MQDEEAGVLALKTRWYTQYPPSHVNKKLKRLIEEARAHGESYVTLVSEQQQQGASLDVVERAYAKRNPQGDTFAEYIAKSLPDDVTGDVHLSMRGRIFLVLGWRRFAEGWKGGVVVVLCIALAVYVTSQVVVKSV